MNSVIASSLQNHRPLHSNHGEHADDRQVGSGEHVSRQTQIGTQDNKEISQLAIEVHEEYQVSQPLAISTPLVQA